MKILSTYYNGMLAHCNACGALLGYTPEDVNEKQNIKCPQCSFVMWVPFNPNYDGVIVEESENKDETLVPEQLGTDAGDSELSESGSCV